MNLRAFELQRLEFAADRLVELLGGLLARRRERRRRRGRSAASASAAAASSALELFRAGIDQRDVGGIASRPAPPAYRPAR